jgi:hypothetical protein
LAKTRVELFLRATQVNRSGRSIHTILGQAVKKLIAALLLLALNGCAIAPAVIKSDSMGFDAAIEDISNKLLLINVLRARDNAPLHFADIPVIRGM